MASSKKKQREREKEGVLTIQNSALLSLIRSASCSSKGSTCSNKAANTEEAAAKLQLVEQCCVASSALGN